MAYNGYLYLLFSAKELVVMHLARYKGVAAQCHSIIQEECTRASAYCHSLYWSAQQLVGLNTFYAKLSL